ncbi:MAG: pyrroline-5-carboxylate reductase dimerization domain-containing protein, partial [Phycisphaerales bacterium]
MTSAGGTTAAATRVFEDGGLRALVARAMRAVAIPIRCCMPFEYVVTRRSAQSPMPTRPSSASVRGRRTARGTLHS